MIAHNLCYTTLVKADHMSYYNLDKEQTTNTKIKDSNIYFVKSSVRPGILPEILNELLSARKKAKNDLKK